MKLRIKVNGDPLELELPGAKRLLDVLREDLDLMGTKEGCGEGECGACSIILDGEVVNSCLIPVGQLDGSSITTIEALGRLGGKDLQRAFIDHGAAQCGICTPGMLMAAHVFYQRCISQRRNPPSRDEIREAIAGNLCRCTGYQKIIDAIDETLRKHARVNDPGGQGRSS